MRLKIPLLATNKHNVSWITCHSGNIANMMTNDALW